MVKLFSFGVALTGGIATGKSTLASWLKEDGFVVIDADEIAHTTLIEEQEKIVEYFGETILENGVIHRKRLGKIIFNDVYKRKQLESLLHPLIFKKITTLAKENDRLKKPYFVDIPLFFETNNYDIERVLVVYTPLTIQLKRLIKRDNSTKEEALKRIEAQIPIEEKIQKATYLIDNSATEIVFKKNYQNIMAKIVGDFNESD